MGSTLSTRKLINDHKKSDLRKQGIKLLTKKPVIKNVDIAELTKDFPAPKAYVAPKV